MLSRSLQKDQEPRIQSIFGSNCPNVNSRRLVCYPVKSHSPDSRICVPVGCDTCGDALGVPLLQVASAHPGRMAVVPVDPENLMDRLRRYEEELKPSP